MLCALPRAVAVKDRDGAMPQPPLYSAQNILRKEETHIAIFHCTIKLVQRSKGKSVIAAAAYRSGTKLVNEWDGMTHDYTRKGGVVHAEIMLPAHAPPEFQDRAILWNSVEQIEKSKDSQLAREVEVALPYAFEKLGLRFIPYASCAELPELMLGRWIGAREKIWQALCDAYLPLARCGYSLQSEDIARDVRLFLSGNLKFEEI